MGAAQIPRPGRQVHTWGILQVAIPLCLCLRWTLLPSCALALVLGEDSLADSQSTELGHANPGFSTRRAGERRSWRTRLPRGAERSDFRSRGGSLGISISENSLRVLDLTRVQLQGTEVELGSARQPPSLGNGSGASLECPPSPCPELSECTAPGTSGLSSAGAGVLWCRGESMESPTAPTWYPKLTWPTSDSMPRVNPHSMGFNALDTCFPVKYGPIDAVGPTADITRPACHAEASGAMHEAAESVGTGGARHRDPIGGLFVLKDVFLDSWGRVFNATHRFFSGECTADEEMSHLPDTPILMVDRAVNLIRAHTPGLLSSASSKAKERVNYLHATAFELPLALFIARQAELAPGTILATHHAKFHRVLLSQLLPAKLKDKVLQLPRSSPKPGTLWRVARLTQPAFQACGQTSATLWGASRKDHLLHPSVAAAAARVESIRDPPLPLVPPATPLLLPAWRVVVHHQVLSSVRSEPGLLQLLHQFFPEERVVTYSRGHSVREDQLLFGHAPLFLTTSVTPSALSKLVFLPPHSTLLILHSNQSFEDPATMAAATTQLAVHLSAACRVRLYIVRCGHQGAKAAPGAEAHGEGAAGGGLLWCRSQTLLEVLDRVALDVYAAQDPAPRLHSPPSLAPVHVAGGADGVPAAASGEKMLWYRMSSRQVGRFKNWAECISKEGRWELNRTPRRLPWPYHSKKHFESTSYCDILHRKKGGLARNKADEVAERGGPESEWAVRDTAKYEWVTPKGACPVSTRAPPPGDVSFLRFSPSHFCRHVGRGRAFLFLGDSLTEQAVDSFVNLILMDLPKPAEWAVSFDVPEECRNWLLLPDKATHFYCGRYIFKDAACPGLRVYYVRNDYLTLPNPRSGYLLQFSRFGFIADADVIVTNRGAHYEKDVKYAHDLTAALRYLRNRFPDALVLFRNTAPGHVNCTAMSRPLEERQHPDILPKAYGWGKFPEQNEIARRIVEETGSVYLDVDTMTALRGDGHKGIKPWSGVEDCLHYCLPGPVDLWNQMLYSALLWVAPLSLDQ